MKRIIDKILYSTYNLSLFKTIVYNFLWLSSFKLKLFIGKKTKIINRGGNLSLQGCAYIDCKNAGQFFYNSHIVIENKATLYLGHNVNFFSGAQIKCFSGSRISVGSETYFSGPTTIHSRVDINIGQRCSISWGTVIIDSDFHGVGDDNVKSEPVEIGDDVWIGCNVIILKGVFISSGVVIAAGSLVNKSCYEKGIYAGTPAVLIRAL